MSNVHVLMRISHFRIADHAWAAFRASQERCSSVATELTESLVCIATQLRQV